MWENAGLVRSEASLESADMEMKEIREQLSLIALTQGNRAFHLEWMEYLSILNYLDVCDLIIESAKLRKESRGSHFRSDFPAKEDNLPLSNICIRKNQEVHFIPVMMNRMKPDTSELV